MTKIDQFESVFKAASKPLYTFEDIAIENVLVISDMNDAEHTAFADTIQQFLPMLSSQVTWHHIRGDAYTDVQELLDTVQKQSPDLVCTYRNLQTNSWRWPYSLGDYLDVLTQESNIPIMVFPHPQKEGKEWKDSILKEVMVITDHLTGDDRLVHYGLRFTPQDGTLFMSHVEDKEVFERYVELFSKIPEIDTDVAREKLYERLLKEPHDYIDSCKAELDKKEHPIHIEAIVTLGHFLSDYQMHLQEHEVDLLVLNTKDDDQFAMHGLAYPIAVEFRSIPLLML